MITVKCCNRVDTFSEFFVALAKRELFVWKRKHEVLLLREVLVEEPHKYRPGSKERGSAWDKIAEHLNSQESGMKVTKRSVREKFDKLLQDFKKREREERRVSGVDAEYNEIHQALTDINEKIADWEEQQEEKGESEKATAEEMRKRATEKLSERKRRSSSDDQESSDGATPKKRKCHTSVTELLERTIEGKATEHVEQQISRQKELELRAEELRQQQQFQAMLLQQQQQFQQQQPAMNMAMLNTFAELLKKNY